MVDQELLLAMSDMMDGKLQPIKEDLAEVKEEQQKIKEDLAEVKEEQKKIKEDLAEVKEEQQRMKDDLQDVKNEVHRINLYQENVIQPRLETIESCYTDTYNRYKSDADKMEAAFADIELLKTVVTEHGKQLQKLA